MCNCAHFQFITRIQYSMRTVRREQWSLRVDDEHEDEVEGTVSFSLELARSLNLQLDDVLYVSSHKRNLISISALDKFNYIIEFGNNQCIIKFNYIHICIVSLSDKIYMLSHDSMMNVCEKSNNRKHNNKTSSKLWHCRLGHISNGRMEYIWQCTRQTQSRVLHLTS